MSDTARVQGFQVVIFALFCIDKLLVQHLPLYEDINYEEKR